MRGPLPIRLLRLVRVALIALAWGLSVPSGAAGHEGPPFPILMDRKVANVVASVWADPDIGEATFFLVVESPEGGPPPLPPSVSMWYEPVSGRLPRSTCDMKRQSLRNQTQFEAQPYFDQRDLWRVGFRLTAPNGTVHEFSTQVESTPPGYGPWDLAIYLFPFLLLGGMWVAALVRRRRLREVPPDRPEPGGTPAPPVPDQVAAIALRAMALRGQPNT